MIAELRTGNHVVQPVVRACSDWMSYLDEHISEAKHKTIRIIKIMSGKSELKINTFFAQKYEKYRQKEELQRRKLR